MCGCIGVNVCVCIRVCVCACDIWVWMCVCEFLCVSRLSRSVCMHTWRSLNPAPLHPLLLLSSPFILPPVLIPLSFSIPSFPFFFLYLCLCLCRFLSFSLSVYLSLSLCRSLSRAHSRSCTYQQCRNIFLWWQHCTKKADMGVRLTTRSAADVAPTLPTGVYICIVWYSYVRCDICRRYYIYVGCDIYHIYVYPIQ